MRKRSFSYYFGTCLIIFSLLGLFYTFYPLLRVTLSPSPLPTTVNAQADGFFLSIPKIKATGQVIRNVDPFNQTEYDEALKKGIAHAEGTYLPGEKGTVFLFAHSSGFPWELTRYNTIFLRLNELGESDRLYVTYEGKRYEYAVREKKEVWPSDIQYLRNLDKDQLILQTCTPVGTDLKRLLIFADPVE